MTFSARLLILVLTVSATAADTTRVKGFAAGTLGGILLIDSAVVINPTDTLIIAAGTTILMRGEHAGIDVRGVLYADGERGKPVQFIGADKFGARWEGLRFTGRNGSELHYCIIAGSIFGIRAVDALVNLQFCILQNFMEKAVIVENSLFDAYRTKFSSNRRTPVSADEASVLSFDKCMVILAGDRPDDERFIPAP